ncbi:MAG TPA: hypothetical protein VGT40_09190 [Methylomirabilota bacterium]|nr:hypothetical protein [Methylomirabilota bacterium]
MIVVRAPALPAQPIPGGRLRKGGEAPLRDFDVATSVQDATAAAALAIETIHTAAARR